VTELALLVALLLNLYDRLKALLFALNSLMILTALLLVLPLTKPVALLVAFTLSPDVQL
jgi:hypothetical protein